MQLEITEAGRKLVATGKPGLAALHAVDIHPKKRMQDLLACGLAMDGLALMEQIDPPR
jgi:hypothetical protein